MTSPQEQKPAAPARASEEQVEAALEARRAELSKARESGIGLLVSPLRTLSLFSRTVTEFALTTLAQLAVSGPVVFIGYPLLLGWLVTHVAAPELYTHPTCTAGAGRGTAATVAGPLYLAELYAYEVAWWLVLGILSSIGFGSGLHSVFAPLILKRELYDVPPLRSYYHL